MSGSSSRNTKGGKERGRNKVAADANDTRLGSSTSAGTSGVAQKGPKYLGIPNDVKELRACMICSAIKTHHQFEEDGCDNCEKVLCLAGRVGSAYSYTSANFEGMISMIDPKTSWVAKWQNIATLKKGVYAVSVKGTLPLSLKQELYEGGFRLQSRDRGITPEELAQREQEENQEVFEERRRVKKVRRQRKKKQQEKRTSESSVRSEVDNDGGELGDGDESQVGESMEDEGSQPVGSGDFKAQQEGERQRNDSDGSEEFDADISNKTVDDEVEKSAEDESDSEEAEGEDQLAPKAGALNIKDEVMSTFSGYTP